MAVCHNCRLEESAWGQDGACPLCSGTTVFSRLDDLKAALTRWAQAEQFSSLEDFLQGTLVETDVQNLFARVQTRATLERVFDPFAPRNVGGEIDPLSATPHQDVNARRRPSHPPAWARQANRHLVRSGCHVWHWSNSRTRHRRLRTKQEQLGDSFSHRKRLTRAGRYTPWQALQQQTV
jgi:hypothetical protein